MTQLMKSQWALVMPGVHCLMQKGNAAFIEYSPRLYAVIHTSVVKWLPGLCRCITLMNTWPLHRPCAAVYKHCIFNRLLVSHREVPQYNLQQCTVEPLYYGHQGDRSKCLFYGGVRFREVGFKWISVSQGQIELSVIERGPYYRGVRKERFHCIYSIV